MNLAPLGRSQYFAFESQSDVEVHQGIESKSRRSLVADRHTHFGARRAFRLPPVWYPHNNAGIFVGRNVLKETVGVTGCPGQRVKYLARIDHAFEV